MEVTKGQAGRKVCGTIEVVVGALIGLGAIVNAIRGFFDIFSFLGAALTILTGSFGIGASTIKWIIGYIITGIISVLFLGFVTIGSFMVIVNYEDYSASFSSYGIQGDSSTRKIFVLIGLVFLLGLIASVLGVGFAFAPICARKQRQDAFQFQRFNDPVGAVGPPPDYNYSNPGYVHTAQTQQNDGNKSVGGSGVPPIYNNSNTASVDTKGLA